MAAVKMSSQDQKDLEKFTKYLVYKCVQVIVQARLGDRIKTRSSPFSVSSDWFNLAITDIPEISAETKKVYASGSLFSEQPMCVEISLKTVEGETMILETWWLTTNEHVDANAKISYTVYSRMGVLLKSLICVSHTTPGYQLSRKQGADSFVVCYRLYRGEPYLGLGEGYRMHRVGGVPTPVGTVVLNMAYRTRMLISPQQSLCRDVQFEVKDDHFTDNSPKQMPSAAVYSKPYITTTREHRNSFGDDGFIFPADPPDGYAQTNGQNGGISCETCTNCGPKYSPAPQHKFHCIHDNFHERPSLNRLGAFAPQQTLHWDSSPKDDIPFHTLLHHGDKINANNPVSPCSNRHCPNSNGHHATDDSDSEYGRENGDASNLSKSDGSASSKSYLSRGSPAPDDFVMVQLKTPFGGHDGQWDLGKFYKACQGAPPLSMLDDTATFQDTLNGITDQLAGFEADAKDFDEFVNSLQVSEG